jgi:hypothetical protein
VVEFDERKEASRLHVLTWKGTACIVTWKGNMKGAFQFGNKGNIRLLVSRNKEGGTGQLENKGKHMCYWLVAAKKRWCWSRVVAAQVTIGTKMPLVHRKAKTTLALPLEIQCPRRVGRR